MVSLSWALTHLEIRELDTLTRARDSWRESVRWTLPCGTASPSRGLGVSGPSPPRDPLRADCPSRVATPRVTRTGDSDPGRRGVGAAAAASSKRTVARTAERSYSHWRASGATRGSTGGSLLGGHSPGRQSEAPGPRRRCPEGGRGSCACCAAASVRRGGIAWRAAAMDLGGRLYVDDVARADP